MKVTAETFRDASTLICACLTERFEVDLFKAAMKNLEDVSNPLRFNNFANAIREVVRHVLERLAPDAKVLKCVWYKNETDKPSGVSRKQRAYYATQGGLSDEFVKETLKIDSDGAHRDLIDSITQLNKYTHVGPETFGLATLKVDALVGQTLNSVIELFRGIDECRDSILEQLSEEIDSAVVGEVLSNTIVGIDELASHHSIEEVYVAKSEVTGIDDQYIYLGASGSISCVLQFGSNSDLRSGDGAEIEQSFPFMCRLRCPVDDPDELQMDDDSLGVDTSKWTDVRYGQDEEP
jgi:hypothetical protein